MRRMSQQDQSSGQQSRAYRMHEIASSVVAQSRRHRRASRSGKHGFVPPLDLRPRGRRMRQWYACARARAKNFPEFFRCQTAGGGGLDQKFLKDTPQFCMFSSVVHAEFCWICGLFPQYARARIFQPRARVYPCARPNFCQTVEYSPQARARAWSMRQG